jgi:hypothetical protein
MVQPLLWETLVGDPLTGVVCFDCLETRANRKLGWKDLFMCPLSGPRYLRMLLAARRNPTRQCTKRQLIAHTRQMCLYRKLKEEQDSPYYEWALGAQFDQ